MSSVHAGPTRAQEPGQCAWRWHWEDVDLACTDGTVPGSKYCAEHLIEAEHAPQIVRFSATELDGAEEQAQRRRAASGSLVDCVMYPGDAQCTHPECVRHATTQPRSAR